MHLYVPTLKKDLETLGCCLQYLKLSYDDVKNLLWLMKQVQWTEGIELLLQSRACIKMYQNLDHNE